MRARVPVERDPHATGFWILDSVPQYIFNLLVPKSDDLLTSSCTEPYVVVMKVKEIVN